MPVDNQDKRSPPLGGSCAALEHVLDLVPCAVATWRPDRSQCVLNHLARQLTGFLEQDFIGDASQWLSRINVRDRELFSAAWAKLLGGETMVSCDYRFYPRKGEREIWLRDLSVSRQDPLGRVEAVNSAYINISDLKVHRTRNQQEVETTSVGSIIDGLVHEIQNNLQIISTGMELLHLHRGAPSEYRPAVEGIDRINKSMRELSEYFFPTGPQFSREEPGVIIREVVRAMEGELNRQGVRLRLPLRSSLPAVRLDLRQFRAALERVIEFSRLLLVQGGELEVEARLREIRRQRYLELQVITTSANSLEVEEKDVFRPFLRVNGHQVGLGMTLTHQILRRHDGQILFQKETPRRGVFTILLSAHAD